MTSLEHGATSWGQRPERTKKGSSPPTNMAASEAVTNVYGPHENGAVWLVIKKQNVQKFKYVSEVYLVEWRHLYVSVKDN